ncbi:TetR/AcrR family transcriptional regulator [Solicola sp. PLA-1-18]|uniref:TetR/AcrR family transcriptional regulator n=1 Tax=Solicola sp. PLA-1-18 TaxID=3380532 RepID=UPI003B7F325F
MARPSVPVLSVDKIAEAALAVVDSGGDLTMPGLASRLGVSASSLYHHVSGKAGVVEAMRGRVFAGLRFVAEPGEAWDDAARRLVRQYRDAFARHPRLIPMLTGHTVADPQVLAMYGSLAALLERAGFSGADLLHAITLVDSFTIGSALDVAAPEDVWDVTASDPVLRAAVEAAPSGVERADEAFAFGLEAVLAGLRAVAP